MGVESFLPTDPKTTHELLAERLPTSSQFLYLMLGDALTARGFPGDCVVGMHEMPVMDSPDRLGSVRFRVSERAERLATLIRSTKEFRAISYAEGEIITKKLRRPTVEANLRKGHRYSKFKQNVTDWTPEEADRLDAYFYQRVIEEIPKEVAEDFEGDSRFAERTVDKARIELMEIELRGIMPFKKEDIRELIRRVIERELQYYLWPTEEKQ